MSHNPDTLLASYIDALLHEPPQAQPSAVSPNTPAPASTAVSPVAPALNPPEKRAKAAAVVSSKPFDEPLAADQLAALEAGKREALARLLQPNLTITPAEPPTPPPEAATKPARPLTAPEPPRPPAQAPAPAITQAYAPALTPTLTQTPIPAQQQPEAATPAQTAPSPAPLLAWHDNGRPLWAQGRFDVLLFQVAGLTLAVPLIALGQIHPLSDELTPIFGQADWFMGLQPTAHGQIRCVNTSLFVMPERYNPAFLHTAKYVVSIAGMDWGLAVDQVAQPTRIHPDEVTWRGERAKRPWLAGTVKSAMCALLDVPHMGQLLQASDPKRRT